MSEALTVARLDAEVAGVDEDAAEDWQLIETSEPVQVQFGKSAGNDVWADVTHFAAISVDTTITGMDAIAAGAEMDGDAEEATLDLNEASIFTSNEDGDIGHGILSVEDGGVDDVIDHFLDTVEEGTIRATDENDSVAEE